ncbi:MAG TPA: glycosyl hydrolase, partial [Chloroflexia bacterium]|nr:glycosyl hydrolase [Chloroflexia bacterium]
MLHGVSFRLLHNPPIDQITSLFARLRQDGCDAIAIIPHHYVSLQPGTPNLAAPPNGWQPPWFIYPDLGQDPSHPFHNTPEPELVLQTCQAARAAGFRVMLKPHIDSYQAGWRGDISVKDHTADWVWGYRNRFLQRYVDIAKQIDGAILCLGCELYTVTKELGPEFWIGVAAWVRGQGFSGPLTYAANWGGWADDAEYKRLKDLWPLLDYIGVDAYFPLFPQGYNGPLDVNTIAAAWHRKGIDQPWCPCIDDDLIALSQGLGKPLLFTEIGYANHQQAPIDPMRDPLPTDVRDDDLQLRLAQAFRQRWGGVAQFSGYFWWEAWLDQANKPPISHDIVNQPVEKIIFQPLPGETPVAGGPPPPLPPAPAPGPTVDQVLALNGVHGPNASFSAFRSTPNGPAEGADACWQRVAAMHAQWIKLLWPDHHRADAQRAKSQGLKVLVRAPGEGFPAPNDVKAMIAEFQGVCDLIEVGNEPYPTAQFPAWDQMYWNHAVYLETCWQQCAPAAHAAGIQLCAPGWQGDKEPPSPDSVNSQALSDRLRQVYGAYDAIAVHCYDPFNLDTPPMLARIAHWRSVFNKPIYLTEYGIAARYLVPGVTDPGHQPDSDLVKIQRYTAFLRKLAGLGYVEAAFLFLLNGSNDFAAFNAGGYDPNGGNSYWLTQQAYAALGQALLSATRDLEPAGDGARDLEPVPPAGARDLGGHIGLDDRPHAPNYTIQGVPTISPAVYAGVLQTYNSPALQEADAVAYYRAALTKGLNPAVALAFFEHESQCGTAGPVAAAGAKNWGNLRPRTDGTLGRAAGTVYNEYGTFRRYARFLDGLLDWCDLMLDVYAGMSIRDALQKYAPASDQNDPNSYANIVLKRVAQWDAASGAFDLPPDGTPPAPAPAPTPGGSSSDTTDYPLIGPP